MGKKIKDFFIDRFYLKEIQPYIDKYGIDQVRQLLYDGIRPMAYGSAKHRIRYALRGGKAEPMLSRDDIWAEYLGIPENKRHSIFGKTEVYDSKFKPLKSNNDIDYKKVDLARSEEEDLIKEYYLKERKNSKDKLSNVLGIYFNTHTIDSGFDKKGQYVSYYDKWDIAPSEGIIGTRGNTEDESRNIGTPIEFYDRIYLDEVYNIPENAKGNPWIKPSIITAKKQQGGMKTNRQKKFLGAVIGAVGSIASSVIQAQNQKAMFDEQQRQQRVAQNQANFNTYLQNVSELANTDNSWAYDKFKPTFKCGGTKRMKAELGKYKARFNK